jgi:LPXTG-motif cell wall-anchored protein
LKVGLMNIRRLVAASVLVIGIAAPATAAVAAEGEYPLPNDVTVLGETLKKAPDVAPAAVAAPAPQTAPTGNLPFTGSDVTGMVIVGLAAVGAGTVLVRRSKSQETA